MTPAPLHKEPERLQKQGLGWAYETEGFRLSVDYIKRRGDELHGVLTITSQRPGEPPHVHEATHNFSSMTSRASLAKHLAQRGWLHVDWTMVLERFCVAVMRKTNTSEPFIKIGQRPAVDVGQLWAIEDLVPKQAMTWWYGARASCKSQTSALMAVCVTEGIPFLERYCHRGRVGILDYEDNDLKWEMYIQAISRGFGIDPPEVFYRHCTVPIGRQLNAVARMCDDEDIDFLIVDSFGLAAGPTGDHSSYEETASNFSMIMKELDRTAIIIDHISQSARLNPNLPADPIGSQYKLAQSRAGYEVRMEKEDGAPVAHLGIFDRKHKMMKPIGLLANWTSDTLQFQIEDMMNAGTEMATIAIPQSERILFQLQRGSMQVNEIADKLDIKANQVRAVLSRLKAQNKVQRLPEDRWGLSAKVVYDSATN